MKRLTAILLVALLLPVSAALAAVPQESYIDKLGKDVVVLLADKEMAEAKRKAGFSKLLTQNFDLKTIGRFVLGRHWRDASDAQRSEYQKLFEKMVVTVYTQRFSDYSGQQLVVTGSVPAEGSQDVFVKSQIRQEGGPPVAVEWRVRSVGKGFKIVDAVVEGVSMSVTQRSDFDAIVAQGGVDGLIAELKNRTANPAAAPDAIAKK
ncbi:MAG TPA: ABC transporter substrate-binding protein [Alphaproteobacteria bacterium]|nr:ABC transporter substrate-binding protein [Alphaproteobacteria bacterium]